jgi:hypothetical protein
LGLSEQEEVVLRGLTGKLIAVLTEPRSSDRSTKEKDHHTDS